MSDYDYALLVTTQAVILNLRLCLTQLDRKPDEADSRKPAGTTICGAPALWRRDDGGGENVFVCDACLLLHCRDHLAFVEAPHSKWVREFSVMMQAAAHGLHRNKELSRQLCARAAWVAGGILHALPQCPMPLSDDKNCERCLWAHGEEGLRARYALRSLTEALAKAEGGKWDQVLKNEHAWWNLGRTMKAIAALADDEPEPKGARHGS